MLSLPGPLQDGDTSSAQSSENESDSAEDEEEEVEAGDEYLIAKVIRPAWQCLQPYTCHDHAGVSTSTCFAQGRQLFTTRSNVCAVVMCCIAVCFEGALIGGVLWMHKHLSSWCLPLFVLADAPG